MNSIHWELFYYENTRDILTYWLLTLHRILDWFSFSTALVSSSNFDTGDRGGAVKGRDNGWCASAGWPYDGGCCYRWRSSTWQRIPIIASDAARGQGNQYAGTNCQFMLSRYYAGLIIALWRASPTARELRCTRIVAECIVQSMRRNDRSGVRCVTADMDVSSAWRRNSRTFQSRG